MGPIFNEKVAEKWSLWVPCTVHGTHGTNKRGWKVNNIRLLFINSSHLSPKRVRSSRSLKKKKEGIFTALWHIWINRNRVLYDGLNPNPKTLILTSQSMACKYKEAFLDQPSHTSQPRRPNTDHYPPSGQWHLIIKIAGDRSRKPKRWSSAYEAINIQGDSIFYGVTSSVARTTCGWSYDQG